MGQGWDGAMQAGITEKDWLRKCIATSRQTAAWAHGRARETQAVRKSNSERTDYCLALVAMALGIVSVLYLL